MEDAIHLELRHHAFEQRLVGNRPGDLAVDLLSDRFLETRDVDGDNVAIAALGEAIDEAVAVANQCPGLPYGVQVEVRPLLETCAADKAGAAKIAAALA